MALDTTIGGETAVSYVSVSEADRYFNSHYSTVKTAAWAALQQPAKESALKRACQQIETIKFLDSDYMVVGRIPFALLDSTFQDVMITKLFEFQRLQIPRTVDVDSNGDAFIPQEFKDANCEQAVHLLAFDDSALLTMQQGIVEEGITAGPVRSYTRYSEAAAPTYISPLVVELLRPFMRRTTKVRRS